MVLCTKYGLSSFLNALTQHCFGDAWFFAQNIVGVAQAEYEAQGTESIGGTAGRVVLLPTIVINNKQYRGRLDTVSVTKALCAGFDETTEPEVSHCTKEISVVVCYHLR